MSDPTPTTYAVTHAMLTGDRTVAMGWVDSEIRRLEAIDAADVRYPVAQDLVVYWRRFLDRAPDRPVQRPS